MKILVISDIHTEFWKRGIPSSFAGDLPEFDVVVAAGDIGVGTQGGDWLFDMFKGKPVIYVLGNHKYYGYDYQEIRQQIAASLAGTNVHLLDPGIVTIDGITFIGATLWSDCVLNGYNDPYTIPRIDQSIADFRVIRDGKGRFTTTRMMQIHNEERQMIERELAQGDNSKTVVVTHFVPSQLCIADKWKGSVLNPYFTNDLDEWFDAYEYPLHIYGHTHDRGDVVHPYGTRLVGNPFGYPRENDEPYQWKVVEIES